jgi:hypothetical protein
VNVADYYARIGPRLGPCAGLADLPDALAFGLRELAVTPAGATAVADADLLAVGPDRYTHLDDLVLYRATETILANLVDDLLREAGVKEKASDLRPFYERRLARLEQLVRDRYGVGLPIPTAGAVTMDFQSKGDDTLDGYSQWGH